MIIYPFWPSSDYPRKAVSPTYSILPLSPILEFPTHPSISDPNSMAITIYYKTVGVSAYGISNPVGARLYYSPVQRVKMTDEDMSNELYGPPAATQVPVFHWLSSDYLHGYFTPSLTYGTVPRRPPKLSPRSVCPCVRTVPRRPPKLSWGP